MKLENPKLPQRTYFLNLIFFFSIYQKATSKLSQSQSCTFSDSTHSSTHDNAASIDQSAKSSSSNTKSAQQSQSSAHPDFDNEKTSDIHAHTETENQSLESGGSITNSTSNLTTATPSASAKSQKQIKWKPLQIDTPKRERKSYRAGGPSRSAYRSANHNNIYDATYTNESQVIPPHSAQAAKARNNQQQQSRARSLDRHHTDNETEEQQSRSSSKKASNQV